MPRNEPKIYQNSKGQTKKDTCFLVGMVWFCGVVVITSALHAEGREFEPRQNLTDFDTLWPDKSTMFD